MKLVIGAIFFVLIGCSGIADESRGYVVVAAEEDMAKPEWKAVADVLVEKHEGTLVTFKSDVSEIEESLRKTMPGRVCFVAQHGRAGRDFVKSIHLLSRRLDEDPYADFIWGIVTGYDAQNALQIAETSEALIVRKVASGTDVALEKCKEGIWYCELRAGHSVKKSSDGKTKVGSGPADSTKALVDTLNDYKADLFVTSGHATERDWQIGFRYKNGSFRCENGQLYGLDTKKEKHPVNSQNPKVYLPIGNCLMGHIDGPDAMALAFMNSAGVRQMMGYTVPTWYGYAGWGCLDYFVEQPGRYNLAEAFFANQHALVHRLATCFPGLESADIDYQGRTRTAFQVSEKGEQLKLQKRDGIGLLFDRDVVAFYGDPGWDARMAAADCSYDQKLEREGNTFTLTITPRQGVTSFDPVNVNGSQRGGRPMIAFLPGRFTPGKILEGSELSPVITDDFVLIPNPLKCDPEKTYRVVFEAKEISN